MSDRTGLRGRPSGHRLRTGTLAWLLYGAFIVYGSLMPFRLTFDGASAAARLSTVPLNPLLSTSGRHVSVPDVAQNVLLFLPFGAIGAAVLVSPRRSRAAAALYVVALASLLSLAVESAQLFTWDRTTSLTDVLADTIGAAVGYGLLVAAGHARHCVRAALSATVADREAAFAVLCAVLLAVLAAFAPFDPTIDVSTIASKVRALQANAWQASSWLQQGGAEDGVRGLLLGAAVAAWVPLAGAKRAALSILLPLTLVTILAVAQLFVTTRQPGAFAWCVVSGGAVVGTLMASRRRWMSRTLATSLVVGAVIVAAIVDGTLARTDWAYRAVLHTVRHGHDREAMPALTTTALCACAYAPLGFAAAQLTRSRLTLFLAGAMAALVTAAFGSPGSMAIGWIAPASALAGTFAGAWMANSGRERFDRAVALADPQ